MGGVPRLVGLDQQSLWLDEAYTIFYATTQTWSEVLHNFVEPGENGPLYTLLMRLWIGIGGPTAVWIRAFSAMFGVLTIPIGYLFYRQILTRRVSSIAITYLAVSPHFVWYSQEGRQYSLFAFIAACSFLIAASMLRAPAVSRVALLSAANSVFLLVGFMTHLFAIWLVVIQAGMFVAAWPVRRINLAVWIVGAGVPVAILIAQNFILLNPSSAFGYANPGLLGLTSTTLYVLVSNGRLLPGLVLGGAAALCAAAFTVGGRNALWTGGRIPSARAAGFLLFGIGAPLIAYYLFSLLISPVALPRYFTFLGIPLFGLMALGTDALYRRVKPVGIAAGSVVVLTFLAIVVYGNFVPTKPEFRVAVAEVAANSGSFDIVVVRPSVMMFPVDYYAKLFSGEDGLRLRAYNAQMEGEALAELRSASGFWVLDAPTAGTQFPDDLEEIAVRFAGHVSDMREFYGIRLAQITVGRDQ